MHPHPSVIAGSGINSYRETNPYSNEQSTYDTLVRMKEIIDEKHNSPIVQDTVRQLQLHALSPYDRCSRVWRFVKSHVRYVEDEQLLREKGIGNGKFGIEFLQEPDYLLSVKDAKGDCDCISLLAGTLLCGSDYPSPLGLYFTTIKSDERDHSIWSHIYVAADIPGQLLNIDCSHGPYVGWALPDHLVYQRRFWRIN